jgi:NarL family two-component system response regulator LiaR
MTPPLRVLIADDHAILRKGIRALLSTEPGIEVVGEAGDGAEALAQAEALQPDVILMDLVMPKMNGIEATRQVTASQQGVRVLVLTSFAADDKVFPAIKAGALGYILKDTGPDDLVRAIRQVHRGEPTLEPPDPLTPREMDVLRLLAQGKSNREIADELVLAELTVRTHVSNILGKLHLANRTQAALYALKEGLATLDDVPSLEEG